MVIPSSSLRLLMFSLFRGIEVVIPSSMVLLLTVVGWSSCPLYPSFSRQWGGHPFLILLSPLSLLLRGSGDSYSLLSLSRFPSSGYWVVTSPPPLEGGKIEGGMTTLTRNFLKRKQGSRGKRKKGVHQPTSYRIKEGPRWTPTP